MAVITGAASGIGRALAERLSQESMSLAIADVDAAGLAGTAHRLVASQSVSTHVVDVADPNRVEKFAQEVLRDHGRATLLINNAGVALLGTVQETSIEEIEWLMRINFLGVVNGVKSFLPVLQREHHAHIVNISSIFGIIAPAGNSAYCASKFAVRGFSEVLRHELEDTAVSVSCVHPGKIRTGFAQRARIARSSVEQSQSTPNGSGNHSNGVTSSAEKAAARIVTGIKNREPRILIGPDAIWLDRFQRAFPVHYERILRPLRELRKIVWKTE